MNRIDRLQAILTTLQSKRVVKGEELADKFEVSVRTIYRDIRALEEGGVPICAEAGIGYYIMKGYHLPPVMFTTQEARSLLLAGKILEKTSDKTISQYFQDALTKVRAVLKDDLKEELQDLEDQIIVNPFGPSVPVTAESLGLDLLKAALGNKSVVTFDYYANTTGAYTQREVEPIGLLFYYEKWHLIGYCRLRQDYRDFRLDRMSKIRITEVSFKASGHPSLKEYIRLLIQGTELQKVVVKVDSSIYKYLTNTKYMMGFIQEVKHEDYYEMEFATISIDYFGRWLLMLDNRVEVMEPTSLIAKMKELVSLLSKKYNQGI
ncbi:MAG TPA: YafY family protein [Cytophagales bacterium]|nr:YafY family protein [Cytophagales bacterium]